MESNGQNAPDGSSLKPVSSLRSHFENMGKSKEASPAAQPSRNQSPSPKPPPIPDTRPSRNMSTGQTYNDGKGKLQLPNPADLTQAARSAQILNPPPLSPKPIRPPAVLIDPPQSPPKGRMFPSPIGDTGAHLNPDPSKAPGMPSASSPRAFKIASRPNTPILEAARSPRLSASQPPSPPPPRRSGELRRDRETRPTPAVPPPVNRAEKPSNRLSFLMDYAPRLESIPRIEERRSPFNSPTTSASSPETEEPPALPSRPARSTPQKFREPPRRIVPNERSAISETPGTSSGGPTQVTTSYPDSSKVNRRPPVLKQGVHEIYTKYDTRIFDVCGQYVCTSGHLTRVWSLLDGELVMSFAHGEGVKATAVAFKPGIDVHEEGARLWIGNNIGEVMEADIATQSIVGNKTNVHGRFEVAKIFRHFSEMWTLDEGGTLHVWGPDSEGLPNLKISPHQTYRLPKGHTFSMIVGEELWHATGKEIRIFTPTADGRKQVQVLMRPLIAEGTGEVTSGTVLKSQPGKVFFGHVDGKVSIFSQKDFACLGVLSISTYKINSLAGVGNCIWTGYNTGRICVYDVDKSPWVVKKEWQAHDNPVTKIIADCVSFYTLERQQVVSLGADNIIRSWDGLLQDDFLENEMKSHDAQYCKFEDINVLALTWNAGASTPNSLRYSESDAVFIQNLLQSSESPDILVFGFQELVDLEDKSATAKRLFKSKKKDHATDQERMGHQYRDWRDFLVRCLDDYMPADHLYHLLHTGTLVGLFTCIFVKSTLRDRVRNLNTADIKRGMGGLHGNKGAIIVRFMIDDTSLCFINCHLAAGQAHANHRHNDIAAIMESAVLPVERDPSVRIDSYTGGGDGSMVLDHELCLLNGDLNYRIDTMSRDTVVLAVRSNNLAKLLDRDQLLVARRRNPAFKLRAFDEMPIQFAPTYKYDVGTDNYDSSDKKRSPAWCDRLLHRGSGRIQQLDYKRHEVRVSDHRPVTGQFKYTIKSVSPKKRTMTWTDCQQRFENLREKEAHEEKLYYLMNVLGYDATTSNSLIQERAARKAHRSPSRHRE
ncbi:Uu.00g093070.m01.CDS01 [Anthostomella pinea]|uniref:Uu.00g093070.m01.CDS01 n=1 Tax=Anthostomella pinea TaxID=933095 RepID=A0AAI8VND1_9PEZI|nr:Uu.00g093070.m01.CDS01 [Anthostomella pinea]